MKFHQEASEMYPAMVPARGRCTLCGSLFDFGSVDHTVDLSGEDADAFDVCESCAHAAPEEVRRRMLQWAEMMHGMAQELEETANTLKTG